ncbi:MAG TPA: addiction module protein [Dongiaceae bacterium]|nr:addiction module protein [Dongiaceae bacterium]
MSATDILEQIRRLPPVEQREVVKKIREEFGGLEDELTPEQVAELDRRAEDALRNPGRGKPGEQVFAEVQQRLLSRE